MQYVLLLWLSMLVLIPFDIAIVDSSLAAAPAAASSTAAASGTESAAAPAYPPLVGTILELCQRYLASPGSTREMAAVVLGRLLTRPDMAPALAAFLDWGCAALAGTDDSQRASFLVPGALLLRGGGCKRRMSWAALHTVCLEYPDAQLCCLKKASPATTAGPAGTALAFATLFKLGQRSALLGPAARVFPHAVQLLGSRLAATNALARRAGGAGFWWSLLCCLVASEVLDWFASQHLNMQQLAIDQPSLVCAPCLQEAGR